MLDGLQRSLVSLATNGLEGKSPHMLADAAAKLRERFPNVEVVSYDRVCFLAKLKVEGEEVVISYTGDVDDKGAWFVAKRGNRMVRFVGTATAMAPDLGLDISAVLKDWTTQWPTRVLSTEELEASDCASTYARRITGAELSAIQRTPVPYFSETAFCDAITLLFTVPRA